MWGEGGSIPPKKSSHLLYFKVSRLPDAPEKMAGTSKLIGLEIFLVGERGWLGVGVGATLPKKIWQALQI